MNLFHKITEHCELVSIGEAESFSSLVLFNHIICNGKQEKESTGPQRAGKFWLQNQNPRWAHNNNKSQLDVIHFFRFHFQMFPINNLTLGNAVGKTNRKIISPNNLIRTATTFTMTSVLKQRRMETEEGLICRQLLRTKPPDWWKLTNWIRFLTMEARNKTWIICWTSIITTRRNRRL